jgi:acyl carrier protein
MTKNQIYEIVIATFKTVIADNESATSIEPNNNIILMGQESPFDSVDLVTFIVSLEQNIEEEYSLEITLADDRAMSQEISPFKSIGSICDYIEKLVKEN